MATRTVTYTIRKPDGSAWAGATLKFQLSPGSYDDEANYPGATVMGTTDANGEGSVDLWTNADGHETSVYIVRLPNGEQDTFVLEADEGAIDLSDLR